MPPSCKAAFSVALPMSQRATRLLLNMPNDMEKDAGHPENRTRGLWGLVWLTIAHANVNNILESLETCSKTVLRLAFVYDMVS